MATSRVTDRDLGWKLFLSRFRQAQGARVKVGVTESIGQEPKKQRKGDASEALTILLVAWWNEFGTFRTNSQGQRVRHVPERSFIRSTTDEQREAISRKKLMLAKRIGAGKMSVRDALAFLGEWFQAKIQAKITRLKEPPNAESTKAKKGSSNPLVDLLQLQQSIRYQVVMGGK